MTCKELLAKGEIKKESIKPNQIIKSINRAEQDIKSAQTLLTSNEVAAFKLAYDSMLLAGRALVFAYGFRPRASGSHKIVVDFSTDILGAEYKVLTNKFNKMRKKRHELIYEAAIVSKTEAKNAIVSASKFIEQIKKHIDKKNPQTKLFE